MNGADGMTRFAAVKAVSISGEIRKTVKSNEFKHGI